MPNTESAFKLHDIVRLKKNSSFPTAAVREIKYNHSTQSTIYTLRNLDGRTVEATEDELELTENFEAPLRYDEIVEIWPQEEEYAYLNGKRGVVTGISVNDETKKWFFGVTLQNGEGWFFSNEEVRSIGRYLPQIVKHMMRTNLLTVQVDNDSSEGKLLRGDSSVNIYRYTPYPIDLNEL